MEQIVGYYNELEYHIIEYPNEEELYRAGNSPHDSQFYIPAEDGVGLAKMKSFCEYTTKEIAKEQGAKFQGVEHEESE